MSVGEAFRAPVFRRRWAGAAALLVLVVAAYGPALTAGFVWDDDTHVTDNPALRSREGLVRMWTDTSTTPQYYPLTHTTFWIEYHLWGLDPRGYHFVNVLLHGGSAILVWLVLRALGVPGAWLGAALFALHPVQVESVAWVTERKNVLSGLLYFAALRAYVASFLGARGSRGRRRAWYGAGTALFALALLAKTVTATLPLTLALVLWWKRGREAARDLPWLAPLVVLGAAFGFLTAYLERYQIGAAGQEWSLTLLERVLLAGRAVEFYLAKLAWPVPVTFVYPRWSIRATDPLAYLYPAGVAAALAILWGARRRLGRGPFVALGHFVIALGPALGLVNVYPMRYSFVADHFQYLATVGPLALAGAAAWMVLQRAASRLPPPGPRLARAGTIATLVGVLGVLTWSQSRAYESQETLWRDTLAKNPSAWSAHNNLGALLGERGELDEAARELREAVRLRPEHAGAWSNLGVVLARQGNREQAADALGRAVALDPSDLRTRHLLADVLLEQGDLEGACAQYRVVLAARPDDFAANLNLGSALAKLGRDAEASNYLERAARLDPTDPKVSYNLGLLQLRMGRTSQAERSLEDALARDPGFDDARRLLERLRAPTTSPTRP